MPRCLLTQLTSLNEIFAGQNLLRRMQHTGMSSIILVLAKVCETTDEGDLQDAQQVLAQICKLRNGKELHIK